MSQPVDQPRRALIVTGEASGDLHGANLIRAARDIDPGLTFYGVGGRSMAAAGCEILIPSDTLAVMGLVEVVRHFPVLYRAFQQLKSILRGDDRPDLLILIDFPDFNLRLARVAHQAGVPVLYYISPKVWAWRSGRVKEIAAVVDRLAVIFPFEPPLFRGLDLEVEYVGNPLTDEAVVTQERDPFLAQVGLDPTRPVVGIFPGSRRNELHYNLPTLLAAARQIRRARPEVQFLLPAASSLGVELLQQATAGAGCPLTIVDQPIYNTINACQAILAVSGTVTLQIGLIGTPHAIIYRLSPLTYAIGRRLVKVPFAGLANIVAGREVAREFIQDAATPEALAGEILRILNEDDYAETLRQGLAAVRANIGPPGCSVRVARMASAMSRGEIRSRNLG